MITTNDVMVGDWVRIIIEGEKFFAVIKSIKQDTEEIGVAFLAAPGDWEDGDGYDEIEPVKLTTDILEANGFDYEKNVGLVFDDYSGSKVIYDTWNHELKILRDYEVILNIKSWFDDMPVHELQHALKLCGVEKEIILNAD